VTASSTASSAASATSVRYSELFERRGTGNSTLAQMSPASISAFACSTVTPQRVAPSMIAQSSEEGPRSPLGPGWTMKQGRADQMSAGIAVVSIGAMIRSGSRRRTASRMTWSPSASSTATWCPRSASSAWTRWVMLL